MVGLGGGEAEVVVSASLVEVVNDAWPAIVVRDLGICVHLLPFIEVILNPAGRFAFVDMAKRATPAVFEECNQPSRDIDFEAPRPLKRT